jgi:hypothetical protein
MGITLKEIAELHPRLYHMAEYGSWPSIRDNGLLSTTALLDLYTIKGESRTTIESTLRRNMVQVKGRKGETAWIRDQRPMSDKKLAGCLRDGLTPTDWYRMLNGKVFFWLTEARLETLLAAYGDRPQLVLEVDTAALLDEHSIKISLTPMNTGCTSPMAFPRGLDSFLSPGAYPFEENKRKKGGKTKAIVELTVDYSVPDIAAFTRRATHREVENGESKVIEVVYERR